MNNMKNIGFGFLGNQDVLKSKMINDSTGSQSKLSTEIPGRNFKNRHCLSRRVLALA